MRSCSGWPCGVWIDGDARTAPDGTSFAWQHWSHTFEYALAAGPGDWRSAGFPLAGLDYNRDLLACETGLHGGPLPATASLASAEPATAVLTALKPRGNPLASGRTAAPRRADGVTVRLRDVSGRAGPGTTTVRLAPGLAAASLAGPTEEAGGEPLPLAGRAAVAALPAAGTVTMALAALPWLAADQAAGGEAARAEAALPEPAQPVFTRYWLHGKGPAPAGNLPVAVHLSASAPDEGGAGHGARITLARAGGEAAALRLTVACGPERAAGLAELDVPPDLAVEPAGPLRYDLPPRGHARWDLRVRARPGAAAGRYFLAARIGDAAGQRLEDAALVTVGQPGPPSPGLPADQFVERYLADASATAAELEISLESRELVLPPGGDGEVAVRLANHAASAIRGEAQLVWPAGSWGSASPWTRGFAAEPGEQVTWRYRLTADPAARPGQDWWMLIKVMYFGRLRYTDAIACSVAGKSSFETLGMPEATAERR
jgi:hypothetical protein